MVLVERYCYGCRRHHDVSAFDLDDASGAVCRAHARTRDSGTEATRRKLEQANLARLERRRRSMIAGLVQIDAEISESRARLSALSGASASFPRVESDDIFGGDAGDADDPGFGD